LYSTKELEMIVDGLRKAARSTKLGGKLKLVCLSRKLF
jgi:hypothetical protein